MMVPLAAFPVAAAFATAMMTARSDARLRQGLYACRADIASEAIAPFERLYIAIHWNRSRETDLKMRRLIWTSVLEGPQPAKFNHWSIRLIVSTPVKGAKRPSVLMIDEWGGVWLDGASWKMPPETFDRLGNALLYE